MASQPKDDFILDAKLSIIFAVAVFLILLVVDTPLIVLENIGSFNSTVTTILGLLFTILAIIYTFESQFEENKAVKRLKEKGQYKGISEIFVISVSVIGLVWIFTFTLTVFRLHDLFGRYVRHIFCFFSILGFIIVIFRLWRCFSIFVLLNRAIKAN